MAAKNVDLKNKVMAMAATATEDPIFSGLPEEMQREIFDYIVDGKHRQKLREVSKSWRTGLTKFYRIILLINKHNWDVCLEVSSTNTSAVTNVILRDFCPVLKGLEEKQFLTRLTDLTISLKGSIILSRLPGCFEECVNVRKLNLDILDVNSKRVPTFEDTCLPALIDLKINVHAAPAAGVGRVSRRDKMAIIKFLLNLEPALSGRNGNKLTNIHIQKLNFTYENIFSNFFDKNPNPIFPTTPTKVADVLNKLVRRNRNSMETLWVDDYGQSPEIKLKLYPWKEDMAEDSYIEEYTCEQSGHWPMLYLYRQRHLKKFTLTSTLLLQWENFLSPIFINNEESLEELYLMDLSQSASENTTDEINSIIFQGMKNLKTFSCLRKYNFIYKHEINNDEYIRPTGVPLKLTNIFNLPSSIRVLNISTPLNFQGQMDFCSNAFRGLVNVEEFQFSAMPWFTFTDPDVEDVHHLDEITLRNLIEWLPNLKKFMLRKRVYEPFLVDGIYDFGSYSHLQAIALGQDTIPNEGFEWIEQLDGISVQQITFDFQDPYNSSVYKHPRSVDYLIQIMIETIFRNNSVN